MSKYEDCLKINLSDREGNVRVKIDQYEGDMWFVTHYDKNGNETMYKAWHGFEESRIYDSNGRCIQRTSVESY